MARENASSLLPNAFQSLPLGSIAPKGWLLKQLRIQARGLSGKLDEFWPDVRDSGWIGGPAEAWERGPSWLDGMVPLAFVLRDRKLMGKVHEWVDLILAHQKPDGWLGPIQAKGHEAYDPWPTFIFLKALTQYQEATDDPRVVPAMSRNLRCLDAKFTERPLYEWSKARWGELLVSVQWLFERTHDEWLLDFARKVHDQGLDWRANFSDFKFTGKIDKARLGEFNEAARAENRPNDNYHFTHGVNNAMAMKASGVWYRQSADPADRDAAFRAIETLDKYHGQVTGMFSCDEHLAGLEPIQGSELCAVVEYMFSLETLLGILGDPVLADRLERIAFNALPATFSADMWTHQYDQQVNQVVCCAAQENVYTNNGPIANIFGIEPNFGCCTANFHQGWPKFAAHLWMRNTKGLVALAYAPCAVETEIAGATVTIHEDTEYPFEDAIKFTVHVDRPVRFTVQLRIPAWAQRAELVLDGQTHAIPHAGTFYDLERMWERETTFTLTLPMDAKLTRRQHNAVAIERGPLVYSLPVGEDWKVIKGDPPKADYEVHPTTPWNYALQLDESAPDHGLKFRKRHMGDCPFSPEGAPVHATVTARRIDTWTLERNAAAPAPESPVSSIQPIESLTLIPYGCAKLRVTEFPTLAPEKES